MIEHRDWPVLAVDEDRVRIHAQHMVHRGEEVLGVRRAVDGIAADRIALADHLARFQSSAGDQLLV